ncbi:hypothetical protein ABKV19_018131 [Rosa sericea]
MRPCLLVLLALRVCSGEGHILILLGFGVRSTERERKRESRANRTGEEGRERREAEEGDEKLSVFHITNQKENNDAIAENIKQRWELEVKLHSLVVSVLHLHINRTTKSRFHLAATMIRTLFVHLELD